MTIAPRDTWPDLRVTIHLFPWHWKLKPRLYIDDVEGAVGLTSFSWLFCHLEWWGNRPLFRDPPPKMLAPFVEYPDWWSG